MLFELDSQQCQLAWLPADSKQDAPTPRDVASIAPVVALSESGKWWIGQEALRLRLSAPTSCILDLLAEGEDTERQSRWPFAPRRLLDDASVAWELSDRLYPRSLIWSKLFLHARERAEQAAGEEIRSMALLLGRGVGQAQRRDLEQGAAMAGIDQLWWIDKIHALGYQLRHEQQNPAQQEPVPTDKAFGPSSAEPERNDVDDPLAKINALLGVQESSPTQATLSQVEFAPEQDAAAQASEGPDPDSKQSQPEEIAAPSEAPAPLEHSDSVEAGAAQQEAQKEDEVDSSAPEGSPAAASVEGKSDSPVDEDTGVSELAADPKSADSREAQAELPRGHWLWMADGIAFEAAKLSVEPNLEVLDRQLIPTAQRLAWEDDMVRLVLEELEAQEGVKIGGQSLAMVRIWDAAAKLMDKLESEAQAELHLPHLVVHRNESLHLRQAWTRRRMDALMAVAVAQLRQGWQQTAQTEQAQAKGDGVDPQAGGPWKWNRFGTLVEMPAWVRVGPQCEGLIRTSPRMERTSALAGAAHWVQERRKSKSRTLVNDQMVGDLLFESTQGDALRCSCDAKPLPFSEDLLLWEGQGHAAMDWAVYHCLSQGVEQGESRQKIAQFELIPSKKGKIQLRVELQRQGKIQLSRSPADRNAGALELEPLRSGLSQSELDGLRYQQDLQDVERFVRMRAMQMREQLARRCTGLQQALQERGAKMDDLLKTRLSEWLAQTQAVLHGGDAGAENSSAAADLNALTPAYEALIALVESLNGPQRKAYALHLEPLVDLIEEPTVPEDCSAVDPSWPLSRLASKTEQIVPIEQPQTQESAAPDQVPDLGA